MESRELTINIHPGERRRKRARYDRLFFRLSLVALAAMIFARLALLMIDVIQLKVGGPGVISIPAYAAVFMFAGWKLREWTGPPDRKETREKCPISESARSAGVTSTPAKPATAGGKRLVKPNSSGGKYLRKTSEA